MCGEDEYYFTTIESAMEFIQNLGDNYKEDLKLTEGEGKRFEQKIAQTMLSSMRMDTESTPQNQAQSIDELLSFGSFTEETK